MTSYFYMFLFINSMDGTYICKEIANLHNNIISAEIVEKGITIAAHVKSGTLPKLERLFAQTELYMNTLQANTEHLGRPHYLMAHNDSMDLFFFPIVINGRKMVLAVRISVPYTHEEIVDKLREYVGNLRPKYH